MHKLSTNVEALHRVVAMLVAVALLALTVSYTSAHAANLTNISNTLTSSEPSVTSGHDIQFTVPATREITSGEDVTIEFPAGFTGVGDLLITDLTVTVNGGAATPAGFSISGQEVTFNDITATSGDVVRIVVDDGIVTNPAVAGLSYEFVVTAGTGAGADTGRTLVAIVDTVLVTAIVQATLDFVVAGLDAGETVNGTTTTGTTTDTEIAFGVLAHDTTYVMGQELTVGTNAANGFVVTVEKDAPFESSTGAIIDSFTNGTYVNTPTTWAAPGRVITASSTWGHWGLTSDDDDLNAQEFTTGGGDRWIAASTTARTVFSHNGPSDSSTQNIGLARVAYAVEITPFQEAGFDYQTNLMYIATPTF